MLSYSDVGLLVLFICSVVYYVIRAKYITDTEFYCLILVLMVILWQSRSSMREHFKEQDKDTSKCLVIDVNSFKASWNHMKLSVSNSKYAKEIREKLSKYVKKVIQTVKQLSEDSDKPPQNSAKTESKGNDASLPVNKITNIPTQKPIAPQTTQQAKQPTQNIKTVSSNVKK